MYIEVKILPICYFKVFLLSIWKFHRIYRSAQKPKNDSKLASEIDFGSLELRIAKF